MKGDEPRAQTRSEGRGILSTDRRPVRVELEHDGVVEVLDEQLVPGHPVERVRELVRVVVVSDAQIVRRRLDGRGVKAVRRAEDLVAIGPASRRDEGIDDHLHAQLLRRGEGLGVRWRRHGVVARAEFVGQEARVPGGRGQPGILQRDGQRGGTAHEVERLGILQAERRQPGESALGVGRERIAHGVQLHGHQGCGHLLLLFHIGVTTLGG